MKRYNLSTLLKVCFIVVSSLAFITSCEKKDVVDTNQLGGGSITLMSFGPCPIQRGAELRIIGANLDKVTSVVLQGAAEITGNDIKRVSDTEIRVMVPQDAEPGIITIKAGKQEVSSITSLTFNEPIIISSITPEAIKAGDVIKIEGDYLNLIEEIIFYEDVHVLKADFKSQTREAIEVVVPKEAQTGKIIVSNGADIIPDAAGNVGIPLWVYSDDELNVALPGITKISPELIKAGSLLTIEGTDLDLVDSVAFEGNVGTRAFVSKTATKIEVNVPASAHDGKVKAVAFSGIPVESSSSLTLVVPKITSIAPNPVKNPVKDPATLTVTGTDLDLISTVTFVGGSEGKIKEGGTATEISVEIPSDAKDGVVTFTTLAEKDVQSAALTFIKPTITGISATSIIAGDQMTITGTDLDLVASVKLIDNVIDSTDFVSQTATQIVVQSLSSHLTGTGKLVLVTSNGSQVEYSQQITIGTPNIPAVTSITPSPVKPGAMLSITGTKLNLVESVVFQNNQGGTTKATQYGSRTETLIEVYVPQDAKAGVVTLTLNAYDGTSYPSPITISGTDPVVDPSLVIYNFDDKPAGSWGVGDVSSNNDGPSGHFYEVMSPGANGSWQWGFANNTGGVPQVSGLSNYVLKIDIRLRNDIPVQSGGWCNLQFTFAQIANVNLEDYLKQGSVYTTGGEWKTISIPLSSIPDLPDPTPTSGNFGLIFNEGGGAVVDFVGLCIDNVRYEHI